MSRFQCPCCKYYIWKSYDDTF